MEPHILCEQEMKSTESFLAGRSRNFIWILGSWSHRVVLVGRVLKACLVPTLAMGKDTSQQFRLPRAPFILALNAQGWNTLKHFFKRLVRVQGLAYLFSNHSDCIIANRAFLISFFFTLINLWTRIFSRAVYCSCYNWIHSLHGFFFSLHK